ncbi:hypothetical protein D3C75_947540 [compost metagenome]
MNGRIGGYQDRNPPRLAAPNGDNAQRCPTGGGRKHRRITGRGQIDSAGAQGFEQGRRALEVRPLDLVVDALQRTRCLDHGAQAFDLIAQHQRHTRQVRLDRGCRFVVDRFAATAEQQSGSRKQHSSRFPYA